MVLRPAGVVFVNADLTTNVQTVLVKQLQISEVTDGYSFDTVVASNSEYVNGLKRLNYRLLVVRSFEETTNRNLADVVIFVSHGLASVLMNKFGPHGITFPVSRLSWKQLGFHG